MTDSAPWSERTKLYTSLAALIAGGGAWGLACAAGAGLDVCPFKLMTGIPCPACGSTRAVLALFEGRDIWAYNPLGLLTATVGLIVLTLLITDLTRGEDRLLRLWRRGEAMLRRPLPAIGALTLLFANWAWTISKGL